MMRSGIVRAKHRRAAALMALTGASAIMLVAFSGQAEAARKKRPAGGGYNPPYAAMVVDVKTGRTLHAENEDALRHPASVTKVMTLYMLFEQLERGKLSLDSPLTISANAASQSPSKLGLRAGSTIEVEDAILALVTKSANDIACAIAENLAGSEEAFAEQMTRKARSLGMTRTVYRNASGLPDPEQVTTARDLTVLARAIQDRFPKYYRYFQTRSFQFAGRSIANHNKLLGRVEGVDGIKTGFTRASGFNLMTNAKTDDRHVVAVVLGGRSGPSRDQIMASLVRSNLPRAFAGARTTPAVGEAPRAVASAEPSAPASRATDIDITAGTTPARRPLDLTALRPVVASAAGASSTTTPSSRWQSGAGAPLPLNASAYAAMAPVEPARPAPIVTAAVTPTTPPAKIEDRLPSVAPAPARTEARLAPATAPAARVEAPAARAENAASREAPRLAPVSAWVIQLGATDEESKAKAILDEAKSKSGRSLSGAAPFTEKVSRDGSTLYRARFSGFDDADEAQGACNALKRSGFSCFATRS
jgi:D-alanyl-D-alanine carboxypeptidase